MRSADAKTLVGLGTCVAVLSGTSADAKRCHPSYKGACLTVNAGDYDCAGGSGNGPNYVRGPVRVVGRDDFRLDADHDGIGCE